MTSLESAVVSRNAIHRQAGTNIGGSKEAWLLPEVTHLDI